MQVPSQTPWTSGQMPSAQLCLLHLREGSPRAPPEQPPSVEGLVSELSRHSPHWVLVGHLLLSVGSGTLPKVPLCTSLGTYPPTSLSGWLALSISPGWLTSSGHTAAWKGALNSLPSFTAPALDQPNSLCTLEAGLYPAQACFTLQSWPENEFSSSHLRFL